VKIIIDAIKSKTIEQTDSDIMFLTVDFERLDQPHIDHLLLTACRDKNNEFIEKFVDQCCTDNKVMGERSVLTLCEYFSTLGDNQSLIKLIELCKLNDRIVYDRNCEFNHFIARNLWERGNSDGALSLLDECYQRATTSVRKSIRLIFRYIIEDTVDKKSEAVLVRLIKSAILFHDSFNEPMPLAYIWKTCFLSAWFSDQLTADQLFCEYSEIRIIVAKRRGLLCYNALCSGQVDVVHRLIEAFLKSNMKEECRLILELLFEYQYACKNLRACSEILKTTLELDIKFSSTYNLKLLNLLMGGKCNVAEPKNTVIPKFDFKF